jgi:DNA-binding protein HU-beta
VNKSDLIKDVASETNETVTKVKRIVDEVFETIQNHAARETVNISGFGKFSSKRRAAKDGVSPLTGKKFHSESCMVPKFKPGACFKNAVQ